MKHIEIHGHRCFRGLHPENTLIGLQKACQLNVNAIEIDLVVNRFKEIIVSHDPWMNPDFCLNPKGQTTSSIEAHNIFEMPLQTIQQYDCGTKINPKFPNQVSAQSVKPDFEAFVNYWKNLPYKKLNIEVKSYNEWIPTYQLPQKELAVVIAEEVKNHLLSTDCMIQSFDPILLNCLNELLPDYELGLLIEGSVNVEQDLNRLCFKPAYYNPDHELVNEALVKNLHRRKIKMLCWTVNDLNRAQELVDWGVDGIITDYPNLINLDTIKS